MGNSNNKYNRINQQQPLLKVVVDSVRITRE